MKDEKNNELNISNLDKNNSNTYILIKSSRCFKLFCYYFIGISVFVSYNAILSGLDCFNSHHNAYHPIFVYPNIFSTFNFLIQIYMLLKPPKVSYFTLLRVAYLISSVCLFLNPIAIMFSHSLVSFLISISLTIVQGIIFAILLICFYSFIIYLDGEYISAFVTGHGFAGIIMNLAQLAAFFIFNLNVQDVEDTDRDWAFFLFFYLAGIFLFINLFILTYLGNQTDFKNALNTATPFREIFSDEEKEREDRCLSLYSSNKSTLNDNGSPGEEIKETFVKKTVFLQYITESEKAKEVIKALPDVNIFIALHGLITFSIFPGILLKNKIFTDSNGLSILIIFLIFNSFDACGRQLPNFIPLKSYKLVFIGIFLRLYFLIIFPLIVVFKSKNLTTVFFIYNEYFITTNIIIFALSNGYIITNSFMLINKTQIKDELKGKASPMLSLSLNLGIFLGSTFAYLLDYLVGL